jgi:hypothetical protein
LIQILKSRFRRNPVIDDLAFELALSLAVGVVTSKGQSNEQEPVHRQTHQKSRQFDIRPVSEQSRDPRKLLFQSP